MKIVSIIYVFFVFSAAAWAQTPTSIAQSVQISPAKTATTATQTAATKPVLTSYAEESSDCKVELKTKPIYMNKDVPAFKTQAPTVTETKRLDLLKEKIRQDPKNLKLIVRLAKEFSDHGNHIDASLLLWKQIQLLSVKDLIYLAQLHEEMKQHTELRKVADIIIGKEPQNSMGYFLKAMSYNFNGQSTQISKEPIYKETPFQEIKGDPKNQKLFKENLSKAIELDPKNKDAIMVLSAYYQDVESNLFESKNILMDAAKLLKSDKDVYENLCAVSSIESTHDETRKFCAEAIKLSPKNEVSNYVYMGISYRESEELTEAEKWFKKAVEAFPDSEFAQSCLGELRFKRKDFVGAYHAFQKAFETSQSIRVLSGYAKSAFQLKKYDESLLAYKNLCRKNRSYAGELRKAISDLDKSNDFGQKPAFEKELSSCLSRY